MSLNLNKIIIAGRLTADPELKMTTSQIPVVSGNIAVNRKYNKENPIADFIPFVAWRKTAEFIATYFKKGSPIFISGELQSRSYTAKDDTKRIVYEVIVDEADFVESKGGATSGAEKPKNTTDALAAAYGKSSAPQYKAPEQESYEEIADDDDLPF